MLQIFYSILTLTTLPQYMVITKTSKPGDDEEVLLVVSNNCAQQTLPSGFPQGQPLKCQDQVNVFKRYVCEVVIIDLVRSFWSALDFVAHVTAELTVLLIF